MGSLGKGGRLVGWRGVPALGAFWIEGGVGTGGGAWLAELRRASHSVPFLGLLGGEVAQDVRAGGLPKFVHLGGAFLAGEAGVRAKGIHFGLLLLEDRFELVHLLVRETEGLPKKL